MTKEEARELIENRKKKSNETRLAVLQRRIKSRKEIKLKSIFECSKVTTGGDVVAKEIMRGKVAIEGLIRCYNGEICPVCSEIEKRTKEEVLDIAIEWGRKNGYKVYMETYTGVTEEKRSNKTNVELFLKSMKKYVSREKMMKRGIVEYEVKWIEAVFNLILEKIDCHNHKLVFVKEEKTEEYEELVEKKKEMWYRTYTEIAYIPEWKREYFKEVCFKVSREADGSLKEFTNGSYYNKFKYEDRKSESTIQMIQLLDLGKDEYIDYYIEYGELIQGLTTFSMSRKLKNILNERYGIPKSFAKMKGEMRKRVKRFHTLMKSGVDIDTLHIEEINMTNENREDREDKIILKMNRDFWCKKILRLEEENPNTREEMLSYIMKDKVKGFKDWLEEKDIKYKIKITVQNDREIPTFHLEDAVSLT